MNASAEISTYIPPPIENSVNIEECQNYIKRFYKEMFQINAANDHEDICVLFHSNRLCVITLAPSHPIVRHDLKISKVDFQVSKNVNRLDNKITGKFKRNAQFVLKNSPICYVCCENGKRYTISSPIAGKLIEINDRLQNDPQILRRNYAQNYFEECYVAIIHPKHEIKEEELKQGLLTLEEYENSSSRLN